MKARIYLRLAKTKGRSGFKISASTKPNNTPLTNGYSGRWEVTHPTISFGLDINVPDEAFNRAAKVIAELTVPEQNLDIAAEVIHKNI